KERVQAMYEDRKGVLWLATQGGGLSQFQGGRFVTCYKTELLYSNFIPPFCEDREGNLWLGTADHGLRRVRKEFIAFYSNEGELEQNKPYPVLEDRNGAIWIGTQGGGLYGYSANRFIHYGIGGNGIYRGISA